MNAIKLPPIGSRISWFGTLYTVRGTQTTYATASTGEINTVTVRMNNGIELNLWWTNSPGCKMI
jgi:hypothetical protein